MLNYTVSYYFVLYCILTLWNTLRALVVRYVLFYVMLQCTASSFGIILFAFDMLLYYTVKIIVHHGLLCSVVLDYIPSLIDLHLHLIYLGVS